MKLEEALLEVMKDSPPNAALTKADISRAAALMAAPAAPAAPPAPEAPAPEKPEQA